MFGISVWFMSKSTHFAITLGAILHVTIITSVDVVIYVIKLWQIQILIVHATTICDYHKFKWKY